MMAGATATYGIENICRLETATMRCEVIAGRLRASGGEDAGDRIELARAIGDPDDGWDESFEGIASKFAEGDVSAYERGVALICNAYGEGPQWFYEARRDSYAEMLATIFGVSRAEVLVDAERVRSCHAAVDLIEDAWS
jgi:hypothetical protein